MIINKTLNNSVLVSTDGNNDEVIAMSSRSAFKKKSFNWYKKVIKTNGEDLK